MVIKENKTVRVGVVGGAGYTGGELLRLLASHPEIKLTTVTSRSEAGKKVDDIWPNLRGKCNLLFSDIAIDELINNCDLVFFATPHGVSMELIPALLDEGIKVIDLSADFRLKNISDWEKWYSIKHACPDLVKNAVYALPEINRDEIVGASLLACPGCYPTSIQLGFLPLVEKNMIDPNFLIANSASGVSGAGKQNNSKFSYAEISDNFKAYSVAGHRHLPEIEQGLNQISNESVNLTFVPHLLPIARGIHSTLYCKPFDMNVDFQELFEQRYANEHFVNVLPSGSYPETKIVRGTNFCEIGIQPIPNSGLLAILVVEDNLVKGAAGQAVQIMNIVYSWSETTGLKNISLLP